MTDVKYLFTTPSYEISKIDVMDETQKMSPKYTQLLDKLLDKMKTPSFEISKIKVIVETQIWLPKIHQATFIQGVS